MNWTTPADIKEQVQRHWAAGRILAAPIRGEDLFPWRVSLRLPDARSLSNRFDDVRKWIKELEGASRSVRGFGYEIEWTETNHRVLGRNRLPARVLVPTEIDALKLIGKVHEADRFRCLVAATLKSFPELRERIARKPHVVLENADHWDSILAVLSWFRSNPRCGLYLRQLDIHGVDTKFIENRRGLLSELLDEILPLGAVDTQSAGTSNFEQRYGLKAKPLLFRLRLLDPNLYIHGLSDISAPARELASLQPPVERVFITENEVNGLAFPDVSGSVVIFGLGYGVDRLAPVDWLRDCSLHYWGDIDTHGFSILDRLRAVFPQTESLLMDRETFMTHRQLWVREPQQCEGALARLSPSELALYDELRYDRIGTQLRLEQERIPFGWVLRALEAYRG